MKKNTKLENKKDKLKPVVGVIMGSFSDYETMKETCSILEKFNIPFEKKNRICSSFTWVDVWLCKVCV